MKRAHTRISLPLALIFLGVAGAASAIDPVYSNWRGLAITGADPVAYFTEGKPVDGDSRYQTEWKGATWRFSSAANRDAFLANPNKYAPQYGGYCAYAVAKGTTASVDPEAWAIHEGKLFLNYSESVQKKWLADMEGFIAEADKNWPGLRDS